MEAETKSNLGSKWDYRRYFTYLQMGFLSWIPHVSVRAGCHPEPSMHVPNKCSPIYQIHVVDVVTYESWFLTLVSLEANSILFVYLENPTQQLYQLGPAFSFPHSPSFFVSSSFFNFLALSTFFMFEYSSHGQQKSQTSGT